MINIATAKKREEGEKGFTLIELLVVVLIIGVLAAIAIPAFLGQQDQAKDAAAQSDLRNAKTAMMSYAVANSGTYLATAAATAPLADYGYTQSDGTGAVSIATGGAAFCLEVVSGSGDTWHIAHDSGAESGIC